MSLIVAELAAKLTADTSAFTAGLSQANTAVSQFEGKTGTAGSNVGKTLEGVGKKMTFGLTAPIVGGAAIAIKSFADFEQQLNVFQSVAGATGKEMQEVGKLAKDLGNDVKLPGTSARDAADAMTELAKGGLSVRQSMDAARGVLQLSAAAQIDNATAATIAANALNSFNLPAREAGRVSDLLAAAANASSAEITDVALSMQQASAVFAAAGIPIEDLTTGIALMANAGIKGSDAGTSLKTMLMALQAPSSAAAAAMQALGINIYDAQGQMLPFREIVGQVSTAVGGMTQQQRDAALATIFGSDAVRAANIVLAAGTDEWDKIKGAVTEAGAAQKLAEAQTKGLNGTMDALKSSLETIGISLGEKLAPALAKVAEWLQKAISWFDKLDPASQNVILGITGIAAAIGPMLYVGGKMITTWDSIRKTLDSASLSSKSLTGALGMMAKATVALGILVALKEAVEAIDKAAAGAAPNVDKMTVSMLEFGKTGKVTGELAKAFGGNLGGLASDTDKAGESFKGFGGKLDEWRSKAGKSKQEIDSLDKALAGMVAAGQADAAADMVKRLTAAVEKHGGSGKDFIKILDDYDAALAANKAATELNAKAAEDGAAAVDELGKTAGAVTVNIDAMAQQIRDMGADAKGAEKVLVDLGYTQEQITEIIAKAIPTLSDFAKSLKESFDGAADPLNRFKVNTDITMKSMRENLVGNIKDLAGWANNLKTLAQRGYSDLAFELAKFGPAAAGAVGEMSKASTTKLDEFRTLFQQNATLTGEAFAGNLEAELGKVPPKTEAAGKSAVSMFGGGWAQKEMDAINAAAKTGVAAAAAVGIPSAFNAAGAGAVGAAKAGWDGSQSQLLQAVNETRESARNGLGNSSNWIDTGKACVLSANHGWVSGEGALISSAQKTYDRLSGIFRVPITINTRLAPPLNGPAVPDMRALGGPVTAATPYIVGERGPELFVPKMSGTIVPADVSKMIMNRNGGGQAVAGTTITIESGAVQVAVGSGDPSAVEDAVDAAFDRLLAELRSR